jgi:hypothetical protein
MLIMLNAFKSVAQSFKKMPQVCENEEFENGVYGIY